MRNLNILSSSTHTLPATHAAHAITASTVDTDTDTVFAVTERVDTNAQDVDIRVWRANEDVLRPFAQVTCAAMGGGEETRQVVAFVIIADTRTLCVITRSGDIAVLPLDDTLDDADAPQSLDIVGTLTPAPVLAVALAPDSSLLVIITTSDSSSTPSPTLHLLSPTFSILSSTPLAAHAPSDTPVTVGWGAKSTQFHGTLGKAAAQEAGDAGCTTSPDDDGDVRVGWRGDAQFFVVSVVEGRDEEVNPGKRVVRIYNRAGILQSTAEPVPGLEHALAWRPSGGLIAGVQRFGVVPAANKVSAGDVTQENTKAGGSKQWHLGRGINGRHDVVFFERNGLRHGEFTLRKSGKQLEKSSSSLRLCWGYRVRALAWNADSTTLSLWIERGDGGDVVQLWTTGNYHWYLKVEIPAPGEQGARLTSVTWHTEDPARLFLSTNESVLTTRLMPTVAASPASVGTGLVGVVDGDVLLLTPFRTQNVPPPMASFRLSLSALPAPVAALASAPPLHVTFAPAPSSRNSADADVGPLLTDILATLSPHTISLWSIRSLPPGKGKRAAVHPTLLWGADLKDMGVERGRQVFVRRGCSGGQGAEEGQEGKEKGQEKGQGQGAEGTWVVGVLCEGDGKSERRDITRFVELIPTGASTPALSSSTSDSNAQAIPESAPRATLLHIAHTWAVAMPGRAGRILDDGEEYEADESMGEDGMETRKMVIWQSPDGGVWEMPLRPDRARDVREVETGGGSRDRASASVGRNGLAGSTLHVTAPTLSSSQICTSHTLSQACTSYVLAPPFLIWTTTAPAHEAVFVRLAVVRDILLSSGKPPIEDAFEKRRIERGARIVTVVPSTTSLVLQMPRGNLETVMPRPLVMEQVRAGVRRGDYGAAFIACRKHRVDLNVLVELDRDKFGASIGSFVAQLDDVDHLNLFLSGLGRSALPPDTIAHLCNAIRTELERRDLTKYVNTILTAHVVKTPPDYEAGLSLLLRLRGTNAELVEDAVKYIIFLVDADRLFDTALGMYDFSLVLLVAQYSQKDPREYLPFLRSLRAFEGAYQHFKIDDHLKRHAKALRSLHLAGPERFEEAKAYVEKHALYADALELWKEEQEAYEAMLELYGDHLFDRREFRPAALAFVQASRVRKAMAAYEKALDWQELFDLVGKEGITDDRMVVIACRVADELGSKQRHVEAARVLLDYVGDVDEAVASLVRGSAWSEARRIASLHKRDDVVPLIIIPGALDARSSISDEVDEIRDLLDKQVRRLDELAAKKADEPEAFYGVEDPNLANVDVMTDVSNPGTMFTRYTVAPTSSDRSRRTSRSKRKLDRKAGRKGTVEEEEYLLKSLAKLVSRIEAVHAECRALLPHLLTLSNEHAREASELQKEVEVLEEAMRSSIERIWTEREKTSSEGHDAALRAEGGVAEASKVKLTEKVPRPAVSDVPWKVGWIRTREIGLL